MADIRRIGGRLASGDKSVIKELIVIDRTIRGLGFVDVNEQNANDCVYELPDRTIFRGIQYVGTYLGMNNIEWLCRSIVIHSCCHVEHSLKRRLEIDEDDRSSVGQLVDSPQGQLLEGSVRKPLIILNRAVYNRAKHTIEDIDFDSHMFSVADAIALYLSCRVVGAELICNLGLQTKHGVPIFQ